MVDLKITNSGDISIAKKEDLPTFHLFWRNHSLPSFKLRWKQGRSQSTKEPHSFSLKFFTGRAVKKNTAKALYDNDEIKQRIIMQLKTEYGSVERNKELGSYLFKLKHEDLTTDYVRSELKAIVEDVVRDYLDSPTVEVKHAYGQGPFYCQNLNVYIYNNNKPFFEFASEEIFS